VRLMISFPVPAYRRLGLTPTEVRAIKDMVTSPDYRHVSTGTLAVLAQRLGTVWASPSTGTVSFGRTVGGAHASACIRGNPRSGFARRVRTRCGTLTPP
jgi:hypothetical protein